MNAFFLIISSSLASNESSVWFRDLSFTLDHEVLLLVSSSLSRSFWYLFKCLSSFIYKYEIMESYSIVKMSTLGAQSMILVNPFVFPISQGVIEAHTYVGTLLRSQPYLVLQWMKLQCIQYYWYLNMWGVVFTNNFVLSSFFCFVMFFSTFYLV